MNSERLSDRSSGDDDEKTSVPGRFSAGDIQGVVVRELTRHEDSRGTLIETYRLDTLPENLTPRMSYVSFTEPLTARGPHEHQEQTDVFAFLGPGTFLLKLWDNREKSPTFGNAMELLAGEERPLLVVVPPGVVHGYRNISRDRRGMVLNYPDRLYRGWGKTEEVDEIRHEDQKDGFFLDFMRGVT